MWRRVGANSERRKYKIVGTSLLSLPSWRGRGVELCFVLWLSTRCYSSGGGQLIVKDLKVRCGAEFVGRRTTFMSFTSLFVLLVVRCSELLFATAPVFSQLASLAISPKTSRQTLPQTTSPTARRRTGAQGGRVN